jgi:MYXO-CTERM domain-containing protein
MAGSSGSSGASGSGGTIIITGGGGTGALGTGGSNPSGGTAGVVPAAGSGGEELGTTDPPGYHSCACRSLPTSRRSTTSAFALLGFGLALLARRTRTKEALS